MLPALCQDSTEHQIFEMHDRLAWCEMQALIRKYMPIAVILGVVLLIWLVKRWLF